MKTIDPADVMRSIFTVNLGVKKDDLAIVMTDIAGPDDAERLSRPDRAKWLELNDIAKAVAKAGSEVCNTRYLEFPSVMGHGHEPPVEVWESAFGIDAVSRLSAAGLLSRIIGKKAAGDDLVRAQSIIEASAKAPDAVVALTNYSTSHTRFRDFLTRCCRTRYASMPLFEKAMLTGSMTADWKEVEARTMRLVKMMQGADMVFITTRNGTSISFSVKGRDARPDTGIITGPGAFSNLPAGEAFLAPVEGTAEGILVLEWAPAGRLSQHITLEVRRGMVNEIAGMDEFADDLREKIAVNPLVGNIAELGIGTNDKASRPDNILETEKILGTIHIALGDNSSFGGRVSVPFHQDFIFYRPTMEIINDRGEKIEVLVEGEPRF